MGSFFVEIPQFADLGKIKAWENEEEGLYYVFLPAAVDSEYVEVLWELPFLNLRWNCRKLSKQKKPLSVKQIKHMYCHGKFLER